MSVNRRKWWVKADPCEPPLGWRIIRRYRAESSGGVIIRAVVLMHRRSLQCAFRVVLGDEVIREESCHHPAQWGGTYASQEEYIVSFIQRVADRQNDKLVIRSEEGQKWVAQHPAIWEYMTLGFFEDGTEREVSMLCVFAEDGMVKLALQDRHEGRSLWVTATTIPEALAGLEAKLQAGTGDWRQMRGQATKNHKKK